MPDQIEALSSDPAVSERNLAEILAENGILPMYGMPTRIRVLYHKLDDEEHIIDRDIELAITEFAPGSQKTKDKVVHTAIGFTADLVKQNWSNKWKPVSSDPFSFKGWLTSCSECGETITDLDEPSEPSCENCGASGKEVVDVERVVTPLAFRTDLSDGRDTKDEDFVQRGMPNVVAQSSHIVPKQASNGNSDLRLFVDGSVWSFNDNARRGFTGGTIRTNKYTLENGYPVKPPFVPVLENQWVAQDYILKVSEESPIIERVVLGSRKTTNLLKIRPKIIPPGLTLDARFSSSIYAAVYSAATLLRKVVAEKEEIDTDEIEICKIRNVPLGQSGPNEFVGEISFSDQLANGSGFVNRVFDTWNVLINSILKPQSGSFSEMIISNEHKCDSACYDCLKEYGNMTYHGLLDWRLGMAYLRVLVIEGTLVVWMEISITLNCQHGSRMQRRLSKTLRKISAAKNVNTGNCLASS